MQTKPFAALLLLGSVLGSNAFAADIMRQIITEFDPEAPAAAAYEQQTDKVATSMYGASADFNVGGVLSTGPEFWMGTFKMNGPGSSDQTYLRQDLWPGESERLDAIRLRWNLTWWEQPSSMRGWYVKGGYSYTRINSRANRILQVAGQGDALPANVPNSAPAENTSLVTDVRHGVVAGFGNRWLFSNQRVTVALGASITANFKRTLTVDGQDPNALTDYNDMINKNLPDTRMSTRPMPEANMGVGYAW